MNRKKSTAERGKFKTEISSALYKNENIRDLILGDTSEMNSAQIRTAFKEHVKSHLFIDDTITNAGSYIFYDVRLPYIRQQTKQCQVVMYVMCHRDILEDYYKDGYYGDRADILAQMVEDTIVNDSDVVNSFGIGCISLDSVEIYNTQRFYGCIMYFSVPNFR